MIDSKRPYLIKNKLIKKADTVIIPDGNGSLSVNVIDNKTSEPIPNAMVSLYKITISGLYEEKGDGTFIAMAVTDQNGYVPKIELPPINQFNQSEREKTEYHMMIHVDGYYPVIVVDIQIYPNITTVYAIKLSSLSSRIPRYEFIYNPEIR